MEIQTNTGERFLLLNDEQNSIIGISTKSHLKVFFEKVEKVYVDETMKRCPEYFKLKCKTQPYPWLQLTFLYLTATHTKNEVLAATFQHRYSLSNSQ